MIRMVVSDLDGTMLMRDEVEIKQETLEMITRLRRANKKFAVASGRSYSALKRLFSHHLHQMYFISENGALIQYQGKTIYKKEIPRKSVTQALQQLETMNCEWVAAGVHTIYTRSCFRGIAEIYQRYQVPVMKVRTFREIPEQVIRISVLLQSKEEQLEVRKIVTDPDAGVRLSYEDDTWVDILHEEVHKGKALEWLLERLTLSPNQIAVFGDNTNDIEMMQITPNSYAMKWAPEDVKAVARAVTEGVTQSVITELDERGIK